jgi:hypothetical protein
MRDGEYPRKLYAGNLPKVWPGLAAPVVLVRPSRPQDGYLWRVVVCPICWGSHVHGAGSVDHNPLHLASERSVHCPSDHRPAGAPSAYVLVPVAPVPPRARDLPVLPHDLIARLCGDPPPRQLKPGRPKAPPKPRKPCSVCARTRAKLQANLEARRRTKAAQRAQRHHPSLPAGA